MARIESGVCKWGGSAMVRRDWVDVGWRSRRVEGGRMS